MSSCPKPTRAEDTEALNILREYLRIPSVHPDVNYDDCVKFLKKQAKSLDLPVQVHTFIPKKPIVIFTWVGSEPTLPSILLNSHMDVVPVFEDAWKHKPFDAHIDEHNNLYARGAQDMKSVGIQHLEAVKRLRKNGVVLKRTVHISFVPDEETGGIDGMKQFVQTKAFQDLNVGVVLDESGPDPTDAFVVFYGERCLWQFRIHCPGNTGHGSFLLENTAGEKVAYILNKLNEFRKQQKHKLKNNPALITADVTTINLTQMSGGVQTNLIPSEFIITFDCRIPPTVNIEKWEETLNQWCKEAGSEVWIEYHNRHSPVPSTKLDDSNIFWVAFKEATDKMGMKLKPQICMGATDARYPRSLGIPGIGFSPMNKTPILVHDHNEYLNVDTFIKGIEIFYNIIISLGNKTE